MKININNEEIEQVKCTTFLGIIIDECLTWKDHINKIAKLITKASGIITKIIHCMSRNALKLIYYALVYPYLNLVLGNTYNSRIQKIMNIQKKIVRLMTFNSYLEHTISLFSKN